MYAHSGGWIELGPTLELGDHTVVLWDAPAVERRCADDEAVDICHGPSFFVVLLIGLPERAPEIRTVCSVVAWLHQRHQLVAN